MKRMLCVLLTVILCFSSVSVFARNSAVADISYLEKMDFPEYSAQKTIGRGSWSAQGHNGAICYDKEGRPLMCFSTQGGFFFVIDLLTGKVKEQHTIIGAYTLAHMVTTAPNGKVYIHFYPELQFNVYDPITSTLTMEVSKHKVHSQDGGCITEDGIVYLGSYDLNGAKVLEYNIETKESKLYGPFDSRVAYIKGVTSDDKYLYVGTGASKELVRMIRYDKETGEQTDFLWNTGGGVVYTAYMINGKIVAYTNGKLHIVDPATLEKEITIPSAHSTLGELEECPYDPNLLYHYLSGAIWQYNFTTREHKRVADCPLDTMLSWAQLPNGEWVLTLRSNFMSDIGYFNPKTNEVTVMKLDAVANAGPNVNSIEITDDGILFTGGYQTSMGAYNINTKEHLFSMPVWHQNEVASSYKGKTYFGVYTDSVVWRYDPEQPVTDDYLTYNFDTVYRGMDANPSMLWDIEDQQDRIFVIEGYKDRLYIGTFCGYNYSGGALAIMSLEDGENPPETELYRHIIPDHSIHGIAIKDDMVYISSTARNGKGEFEYPDTRPQIAVFDINKKEVVKRVTPDFPVVGTSAKSIGEISFGPDGLLYGAVSEKDGLIFAMDPETFEIVRYVALQPGFSKDPMARPAYLRWGDDGFLYTCAGWQVFAVNPLTMEYKKLAVNCSIMTLDHNGNIWFAKGGGVFHIDVNQYDRLQGFLKALESLNQANYTEEEWKALSEAIAEAKKFTEKTDPVIIQDSIRIIKGLRDHDPYIEPQNAIDIVMDGEKLELDYDTTGVTKIYNSRTLVPYRAILEKLGYKVKWDVHKATITAEKEGSTLSMIMNENIYTINGEKVEYDTPPVLLSGRQYIPIRLIAESLGYEVIWNEAENTVELNKK